MTKKRSLNRKEIRGLKKKGIALAMFLALTFSAVPINAAIVSAATDSATYLAEATTTFTFTNDDVTAEAGDESSYTIDGTNLTITKSGTYILTGSCAEGSVTVKKGTQNVTIVLQDLELASSSGAPITINKNNSNTKIIIAGTNTLTDNEDPADEESTDEAVADAFDGAAIKLKSNGSLLITGDGVLNINGNCKNGIKGADSSTITIGADADDTFTLNVDAANDGIKSDYIVNIGQEGTDEGATINITNSYEGIEGAIVNLYGGNATVVSSDDGINAANSELGEDYAFSLNIYGGAWDRCSKALPMADSLCFLRNFLQVTQ